LSAGSGLRRVDMVACGREFGGATWREERDCGDTFVSDEKQKGAKGNDDAIWA
jgi:hypothetical protein